jgi:DNA-binding response OmpR family regulator
MPHKDAPPPDVTVAFGAFQLYPRLRRLERGGESVALGSRALEILLLLAERPGEVVSKRDLIRRANGTGETPAAWRRARRGEAPHV